jgi:uncharacterized protein
MNILIDISHPAHVHYYKNLAGLLTENGHKVFWTTKPVPSIIYLLDIYGFRYKLLPIKRDNLIAKLFLQGIYDVIVLIFCLKNNIDIAIGTSVTITHVSKVSRVKSIVFDDDDDEVQPLVAKYVHPFADALLSPDCLKDKRGDKNTIFYPGYHELAYLHPKRFSPDKKVLEELSISPGEPFFIMRFNVFKAHHDIKVKGLSLEQKLLLVKLLEKYGKVFITTERNIEPELTKYRLKVSPDKIHSLIYYCNIFIGDSQTMTSEAAVLGIPSLRCNTLAGRISYLEEQEKRYDLTYAFKPDNFDSMILKLKSLLSTENLKDIWSDKRDIMLKDKIDVTAFWFWFVQNYPGSIKTIKKGLNIFSQFK